MNQKVRMPGEEVVVAPGEDAADIKAGTGEVTELNNIAGKTANDVGADRENVVRAQAMAAAAANGQTPDLAPAADIGAPAAPTSIKRKAIIGGVEVEVEVPILRKNEHVERFGPESRHPKGTLVKQDGSVSDGDQQPYGVIGDIMTPQGKLVNRVIPFDSVKQDA